jgi:hypothetical protein
VQWTARDRRDGAAPGGDPDRLTRSSATSRLGSAPSTVESVRLDPELKDQLVRRADAEGVPVSEVIREALRNHLEAS